MDPITTSVIASAVYDVLKAGAQLTVQALCERLDNWIRDNSTAQELLEEVEKIGIDDTMSEKAIAKQFDQSSTILAAIHNINTRAMTFAQSSIQKVEQFHNGSGDNVAGNKLG